MLLEKSQSLWMYFQPVHLLQSQLPTVEQWGKCEKIGNSSWASTLNFNISFVNSTYYFGASIMNDNQKYNGDFDLQIVCTNVNNITLFKQEFVTDFSGNDRGYLWIAFGH